MSKSEAVEKDLGKLNEFIYKDTSHGQRWYYGIDKDTGKKARLSEVEYITGRGLEFGGQSAVWRSGDSDMPIKVTGVIGEADSEKYYQVEGSKTGLPENQIIWPEESAQQQVLEGSPDTSPESISQKIASITRWLDTYPGTGQAGVADEIEHHSELPEDLPVDEKLTRMKSRLDYLGQELNSANEDLNSLKSELDEKNAENARLIALLEANGIDSSQTVEQPEELADPDVPAETELEAEAPAVELSELLPPQSSVADRFKHWRDRLGLGAVRLMTKTRYENGQVVEQIEERRGSRWPAFVVGGLLGAGAVWLAMRGNNSGIDILQLDVDQLQADLDNLPAEITEDFKDDFSEINDRLEDLEERLDELEGVETDGNESPDMPESTTPESEAPQTPEETAPETETPSETLPETLGDRLVIQNHGPVEDPGLYGGENVQIINAEDGQSNFAVVLPEGWSVDNVGGHQVMYDALGNNILEVGQEIKINGKPEVLENFMDSQGNISKQGREALRSMGYDLTQGLYEFKRRDGTMGQHFMTIVRKA